MRAAAHHRQKRVRGAKFNGHRIRATPPGTLIAFGPTGVDGKEATFAHPLSHIATPASNE
jgi:hypothetical protein